jgi:hypothetical protein
MSGEHSGNEVEVMFLFRAFVIMGRLHTHQIISAVFSTSRQLSMRDAFLVEAHADRAKAGNRTQSE